MANKICVCECGEN